MPPDPHFSNEFGFFFHTANDSIPTYFFLHRVDGGAPLFLCRAHSKAFCSLFLILFIIIKCNFRQIHIFRPFFVFFFFPSSSMLCLPSVGGGGEEGNILLQLMPHNTTAANASSVARVAILIYAYFLK